MMKLIYIFFFVATTMFLNSCKSSKVVCPGAGQHKESDMSLFDEEGKPIVKKKKKTSAKKNENGLINRDQPSHTKRYVKKSINDVPKR